MRVMLLLAAALAGGCVSTQRHAALELQYESESSERMRLAGQVEQLRHKQAALVAELSGERERTARFQKDYDAQVQQNAALQARQQGLSKKLEQAMQDLGRLEGIEYEPGSGRLKLSAKVLFEPGQSAIRESGRTALSRLAAALKGGAEALRIEGHTDADPVRITRGRWQHGNWELSGYRALAVLAYLESQGVEGPRLRFVGRGPHRPVASNATEQGKARNRRVEIFILPAPRTQKVAR